MHPFLWHCDTHNFSNTFSLKPTVGSAKVYSESWQTSKWCFLQKYLTALYLICVSKYLFKVEDNKVTRAAFIDVGPVTLLKRDSNTDVFLSTWPRDVFWKSYVRSTYVLRSGDEFCKSLQSICQRLPLIKYGNITARTCSERF